MTQAPPSPDHARFARAAEPGPQAPIHTGAEGLLAGPAAIPTQGGTMPAYRAAPATPGPHPVVLVVQEIFGVHEHIEDVVRRLAKQGYLAIAPALYFRLGDPAQAGSIDELMQQYVYKTPDAQVLADLDATLAWVDQQQAGSASPLGITGFCWGGRITWLYAAHQPRAKAAVAWYGRLEGKTSPLMPRQPADVIGDLKAPVLGLYGGQDTGIPVDSVERMQAALVQQEHGDSQIHVYPEAPHAFFADYRPSYRADDARDGWQRLLDWFQRHGVRP